MISTQLLKRYPYFAGVTEQRLIQIANNTEQHPFTAGEELCVEGAVATHFYILFSGEVEVVYHLGDNRRVIADTLLPGHAFGWSALIEPHRLTASCVGSKAGECLKIDGKALRQICQEDAECGCRISMELAKLLRDRLGALRVQLAAAQDSILVP